MTKSKLRDVNRIGVDSTIAKHIDKIQVRNYIRRKDVDKEIYLQSTILGAHWAHVFNFIRFEDSSTSPSRIEN